MKCEASNYSAVKSIFIGAFFRMCVINCHRGSVDGGGKGRDGDSKNCVYGGVKGVLVVAIIVFSGEEEE